MATCKKWLSGWWIPLFHNSQKTLKTSTSSGQSTVQYILVVAIASVALFGILQGRMTSFQTGMDSVKGEMVQYIGGNRRLPERWYGKETNPFEGGVETGTPTAPEEGAAPGAVPGGGPRGPGGAGGGGDIGAGFFGDAGDAGLSPPTRAGPAEEVAGGRGRRARIQDQPFEFQQEQAQEAEAPGGELLARGERPEEARGPEARARRPEADEEEGESAQLRKPKADEEVDEAGGRARFDWATLIKLMLIAAIILILIVMLLGSLGKKADK